MCGGGGGNKSNCDISIALNKVKANAVNVNLLNFSALGLHQLRRYIKSSQIVLSISVSGQNLGNVKQRRNYGATVEIVGSGIVQQKDQGI